MLIGEPQMEKAFDPGYDPALEIASHAKVGHIPSSETEQEAEHLRRQEQDLVDRIIAGEEKGHYYMLLGSKVRLSPTIPPPISPSPSLFFS